MMAGTAGRPWPIAVICAIALSVVVVSLSTVALPRAGASEAKDRYIVVLEDSVKHPAVVADRHSANRDADVGHVYRYAIKGYSAKLSSAAVGALLQDPAVAYIEPDRRGGIAAQETPTGIDRSFVASNAMLDIDEEDDKRADVDVAVFDTGVAEHADLDVVSRVDCTEGASCEEGGTDGHGHGTHVAGTIAAIDNGFGVVGVAPGARIWAVKVLDDGGFGNLSEFIAGIDWVTARAEQIEVANASLRYWGETSSEAFSEALDSSINAGIVQVAAAGNEEEAVKYLPGVDPDEITVSAVADSDGKAGGEGSSECYDSVPEITRFITDDALAWFSNYGEAVDVAAPGVCILSTILGGGYGTNSGTSMASPHIAGAAALLAAQEKPESRADVEAVRDTIVEEGNSNWEDTSGDGTQEPLLDVSDESVFRITAAPTIASQSTSEVEPATATLVAEVNPNGAETTYQFEYGTTAKYGSKVPASPKSIGSGTSPVEVSEGIEGLEPETTYHFRLVATNAKGTTKGEDQSFTTPAWEIVSTLNPEGADDSYLYDVSCEPSTSVCTAVGKSTSSGVDSPLAHRWNGSSWSEQSPAKKSGSTHNRLLGVDCPSETRCIAVGSYQNSEGGPVTLGEIWNGTNWNIQSTPVPEEATSSELVAVGCSSTARCGAVGSAVMGGVKTAIAEKWISPTWSLESIPIPEGATSSQLDGVDCIWSNFCVAVGRYTDSEGSTKSLAMFWNGTEWELQTPTDPEGAVQSTLLDVSCTKSPNLCTAVGGWKNSENNQFTLAYRFNGSTWTLQSTPNPAESIASVFQEVSCATETSCTAAGSWVSGAGGSNRTLAEEWDGSSWSIQGTPNPAGSVFSAFFGVSCQESGCFGVGYSTDESGDASTLGEIRE